MGIQIPAGSLVVSIGNDGSPRMEVRETLVRLDLWLTWLEIGCEHARQASDAGDKLSPELADDEKFSLLTQELHAGLVAITAFAFAFDGFYDTMRNELGPHPDHMLWRKNRTARHKQVTETFRFHLKLGPQFSAQLGTVLKELFEFRGRAVHPSSAFVRPNYRPQIDSGVHPHLITFSGPHAVQMRALSLELPTRLVGRGQELARPEQTQRGLIAQMIN